MSNAQKPNRTPKLSVDVRSPFCISSPSGSMKDEMAASPDVGKVGEGLADRAASANEHLKSRLKSEQYGTKRCVDVCQMCFQCDRSLAA